MDLTKVGAGYVFRNSFRSIEFGLFQFAVRTTKILVESHFSTIIIHSIETTQNFLEL